MREEEPHGAGGPDPRSVHQRRVPVVILGVKVDRGAGRRSHAKHLEHADRAREYATVERGTAAVVADVGIDPVPEQHVGACTVRVVLTAASATHTARPLGGMLRVETGLEKEKKREKENHEKMKETMKGKKVKQ
jgi:hypothetical protein